MGVNGRTTKVSLMSLQQHSKYPFVAQENADPIALAQDLANEVATVIRNAIEQKGSALVAFSGGSTPKPLFEALANRDDIDWNRVKLTLVDERFVDENNALSNAAFLKRYLINHLPGHAAFIPLYRDKVDIEGAYPLILQELSDQLDTNGLPRFDAVVLGMGGDGHTASFFPDAQNIDELVTFDESKSLDRCESPSTQVPRITWSLASLLNTSFLALHFTGESKKAVFNTAVAGKDLSELPIRSVLLQSRTELKVFYAA